MFKRKEFSVVTLTHRKRNHSAHKVYSTAALGRQAYGSWPKLMQSEIIKCPAVSTALFYYSCRQFLFGIRASYCEHISYVSIPDHSAATLASCSPIHFVGHLKPRGPWRQAGSDLKLFGP